MSHTWPECAGPRDRCSVGCSMLRRKVLENAPCSHSVFLALRKTAGTVQWCGVSLCLFGVAESDQECVLGGVGGVGGGWVGIEGALLLGLWVEVSGKQVSDVGVDMEFAGPANLFGSVTETLYTGQRRFGVGGSLDDDDWG